jgi:hypothetical protein
MTKTPKYHLVSIRITQAEREALERIAAGQVIEVSLAAVIRRGIQLVIEEHRQEPHEEPITIGRPSSMPCRKHTT